MKALRMIHSFLAIIPFIWFLSFAVILVIGIIHFGYVPKEGNPVDPYKLGLDWLNIFCGLCLGFAVLAFFLWVVISFVVILSRQVFTFNKASTFLLVIGVFGFFIFRFFFPEVFGWVLD